MLNSDSMHLQEAQIIPYSRLLEKIARKRCADLLDACAADLLEAKKAIRERLLQNGWTEAELS